MISAGETETRDSKFCDRRELENAVVGLEKGETRFESHNCALEGRDRDMLVSVSCISLFFLIVHIDIIRRGINPDNVTGKVINNSVSVVFIFYHKFPTNSCPKSAFFNICYLLMKSILFF